jgi:DNA-binding beta-propeller fold protein YncE
MKISTGKLKFLIVSILKFFMAIFLLGIVFFGIVSTDAVAEIETSFLYNLSNFDGPVPFNWAKIQVDEDRNEIYVADTRGGEIRIFNENGMEIYRFGDDGSLGTILDVAVKNDGNILVLSRKTAKTSVVLCNFKGVPISTLELIKLPPDYSDFSPNRMVYKHEQLYLLNKGSLKLAVTDPTGIFKTGYDIGSLINVEEEKRAATEIGGFSVDRKKNMLFTVPVLFSAFKLTPDGKITGFGRPGSAPGRFGIVGGIVADDKGYYYVADRLKSVVIVFDKDLKFQTEFGYRGIKPDNLIGPRNLELDKKGKLYVSQLSSRGISVFKIIYK